MEHLAKEQINSNVHNADDMALEIRSYANDFDAEEHAKMWIEAQDRVAGVPNIKTLVKDADDIELMLNELTSMKQSLTFVLNMMIFHRQEMNLSIS